MRARTRRRRTGHERRPGIWKRATRFLRSLFTSGSSGGDEPFDPPVGGVGVREPRRPLHPSSSGAVALEPPPTETHDVWAVGDDDRG